MASPNPTFSGDKEFEKIHLLEKFHVGIPSVRRCIRRCHRASNRPDPFQTWKIQSLDPMDDGSLCNFGNPIVYRTGFH